MADARVDLALAIVERTMEFRPDLTIDLEPYTVAVVEMTRQT